MAWIDPVAFLRSTPPFDDLPESLFDEAAQGLEIGLFPKGTWLVRVGGAPLEHLWVIRKGVVRLERGGQPIQVLEEGESFGYTSLLSGQATLDVRVEEDLLAYRIPAVEFRLLTEDARFAAHFAAGLADRLQASLRQASPVSFQPDLSVEVGALVRRAAVWVEEASTVGEAAQVMARERISSVLVRSVPPGIVTDRDFRNRVLADGLGPSTPVAAVLSRPLKTVEATAPVYEAWLRLLDAGVHHLAVVRHGAIDAVLTSSDLLRTAQGPMSVLRQVERLATRESLSEYPARLAEMASTLLDGGLDAQVIAAFVARLDDALVGRILRWAERDLGDPPAPYAWIAFGSEGRSEQTLVTSQDNGLVFGDEGAGRRDWFQSFAERVNGDLERAGFPESKAGQVARRLLGTRSEWARRLAEAISRPAHLRRRPLLRPPATGGHARPRSARGGAGVRPRASRTSSASWRRTRSSSSRRRRCCSGSPAPPRGSTCARRGSSPSSSWPAATGSRCGAPPGAPLGRLAAAREAGLLGDEANASIPGAFQFLHGLRLRLQLRMAQRGEAPRSEVPFSALSAIERTRLKDAFRAIRSWQETAAYHFQSRFL